jgi:hypothetical protein
MLYYIECVNKYSKKAGKFKKFEDETFKKKHNDYLEASCETIKKKVDNLMKNTHK